MKFVRVLLFFSLLATIIPTSASAQQIVRDYNRSVDFSTLKTYAWLEQERIPIFNAGVPEDLRSDNFEEWDQKIQEAVDEQLQKKKFRKVDPASADFLVSYFLVSKLAMDVQEYDSSTGANPNLPYGHWRPFYSTSNDVLMKREGTLTLDVINPDNKELFWRGTAVESVKEKDSEKKAWKKLEKAIKKTLGKFPPR